MSVTKADVVAAAERIAPYVHRTPVLTSQQLNDLVGAELFFKCEHLQKVGAFKARGATNAVFSLGEMELRRGVATHSSGNHGAALARAAALRSTPAFIVMPSNAKQAKKDAVRGYGAQVIECEPTLEARETTLAGILDDKGAIEIHPYDDPRIIAGQGTTALELVEQVTELDAVIAPVGGGGLLAGCSLVLSEVDVPIFGAEPKGADDAFRSLQENKRIENHVPNTICDGLLTTLGVENFEIIKQFVSGILLADDKEIVEAMRLSWTRLKQVVEPSSAITLAALIKHPDQFKGKRVGLVLTGGNVDLSDLPIV